MPCSRVPATSQALDSRPASGLHHMALPLPSRNTDRLPVYSLVCSNSLLPPKPACLFFSVMIFSQSSQIPHSCSHPSRFLLLMPQKTKLSSQPGDGMGSFTCDPWNWGCVQAANSMRPSGQNCHQGRDGTGGIDLGAVCLAAGVAAS